MAGQVEKGKAFEYACLSALQVALGAKQEIMVEKNAALKTAFTHYSGSSVDLIRMFDKAAQAAVRIILRLEPQLSNHEKNIPLYLSIQEDAKGQKGDVRDVLCIRKQNEWEIGLSCKHNHMAVKHSRLSKSLNFGKIWFEIPCSDVYFEEIRPLFKKLEVLKDDKVKWSDLLNKSSAIYMPLLNAFVSELKRLDEQHPGEIPPALLKYLLGKSDFYKVITHDKKMTTQVQAYNLFGTLNRRTSHAKAETNITQLKLPTKIFDISFKLKSQNTIIITCDGGWALSFRIHSASTYVEMSLKFDIQLVGVPPQLHTQIEPW